MDKIKKITIITSLLLLLVFALTACNGMNGGTPQLEITSIERGVTHDTDTPYYIGYVENLGDGSAKYTEARIKVYASEDKNATINSDQYYIGEIKPGQEKFFRFNFPEFAPLTDISNYDITFDYEYRVIVWRNKKSNIYQTTKNKEIINMQKVTLLQKFLSF